MNIRDYEQENGGIIFPNPNAPTGVLETVENIETIVKNNPDVVVIVDEAYIDFGGTSVLPLVENTKTCWWCRPFPNHAPWRACVSVLQSAAKS